MEGIIYDKAGKKVLKKILVNYRWALILNRRSDKLLLPLATSLDEPKQLAGIVEIFDQAENLKTNKPLYMEVELSNQPADFFFKLATYLDSHLSKSWYLWRTGAVLDFYGNKATRAIIEMTGNVLSIRSMGENKENFQQLLLINVRETLNSYKSKAISAHSYERIWFEGTSQMLSSDIIASLTSGSDIVDDLMKQKLKGAVNMTTINIAGDVVKSNIGGEHNEMTNAGDTHIHITQVNKQGTELVGQLKKLADALPESKQNEINQINQSIALIKEGIDEKDNKAKKSLMRKGLDGVKDLVVIDEGLDLVAEYAPTVVAGAATLLNLLNLLA